MNNDKCCSGHSQPDDKIEKKLLELEDSLQTESAKALPMPVSSQDLLKVNPQIPSLKDDMFYFSGIALLAFGILALFQHIRVGTGLFQALGMTGQGFGFLILPLLLGIGLIVYNPRNKLGYLVLSIGCAFIFYSVLASLIMSFPPMSLLALIFMFLPLAVGGAFIVKGMGGPAGIEYRLRKQGLIKASLNKVK
jgi:hypothetical protein